MKSKVLSAETTRSTVFVSSGLAKTTHTLRIVPTATHNAVATGNEIVADAVVTR